MMTSEPIAQAPDPVPRDPRQPADFDPVAMGRALLRSIRVGALGTLDGAGAPFVSLTSVATDLDGSPLILISGLSAHTKNLAADPRCSLMLSEGGKGDPLAHPRLTLQCRAEQASGEGIRRRFLARHPKAKLYVDFPDFVFIRLAPSTMHLNGGFARAFDGDAALIMAPEAKAADFVDLEAGAITHMNEDHADALELYATAFAGERAGPWRATGLDPHGLDLALGDRTARIVFPARITAAGDLRSTLKALADRARAAGGKTGAEAPSPP